MATLIHAAVVSVAFASDHAFSDDTLSLLQTRSQKHVVSQEPTLADGSVLRLGAAGTVCAEDEVITFAKCVEAQRRQIIPNNMRHGSVSNKRDLFKGATPSGCYKFGTNGIYFNDEPVGYGNAAFQPICQVGGGGGRAAEVVAQGLSCQEPTCKVWTGPRVGHGHMLIWDDSLFVPELKLGALGGVCEEACGILTFEQCSKAGDMFLVDALTPGNKVVVNLQHQTFGPSHQHGTMPSGCSASSGAGFTRLYFNSMDTPSGVHAAPDTDGDAWVTPSGVGTGWSNVAPICGVCTTTTTTPAPTPSPAAAEAAGDESSAVGDPHLTTNTVEKEDLCCEGGLCEPCPQ